MDHVLIAAMLALLVASCSSSSPAGVPDSRTDTPHDATDTSCVAPGFASSTVAIAISEVDATIDDTTHTALASVPVQIRGINLAESGATDGTGHVTVSSAQSFQEPAFVYGDAITQVELGIPLTMAMTSLGTLVTTTFPDGQAITPGQAAVSGGATLTTPASATVLIDTLTYETADQQEFRAAALPIADQTALLANAPTGIELLYGISPLETAICPRAALTLPNNANWAANAAVEFFVNGLDVTEQWSPYGGWAKISDGVVSADGMTVSTATDGGLPILETIGVRLKQ